MRQADAIGRARGSTRSGQADEKDVQLDILMSNWTPRRVWLDTIEHTEQGS